jgi:CheY-like chemotaxis protein
MLRILVVDDIYTNRYLLAELVKLTGNEAHATLLKITLIELRESETKYIYMFS